MPIKVECDVCGKKYQLADNRAGTSIPCKDCGSDIDVPGRAMRSSGRRSSGRQTSRRGRTRSNGQFVKWIVVGVAATIAAVVAFVVVPRLLKNDAGQQDQVAQNNSDDPDDSPTRKSRRSTGKSASGNGNSNGGFDPDKRRAEAQRKAEEIRQKMQQAANGTPTQNNQTSVGNNTGIGGSNAGNIGDSATDSFKTPVSGIWRVEPNPPGEQVVLDAEKKINIRNRFAGITVGNELVFPHRASPFVAVGGISFGKTNYDVWDLSTVRKVGVINGSNLGEGALSPDGKHYACRFGGRFGKSESLLVLDIAAKKPLPERKYDEDRTKASYLEFATPFSLVAITKVFGGDSVIRTWDVPSMESGETIDTGETLNVRTATISPGGRYLAAMTGFDKSLKIFDLNEGSVAGTWITSSLAGVGGCAGLAFSPDGEEISGFFEGRSFSQSFVISWNLSDGSVAVVHQIPKSNDGFETSFFVKGRAIVWFADNSKWLLLGRQIVDREVGGPIWSIPIDPSENRGGKTRERRVLDGKRVLTITGTDKARVLGAYPFPEELLAEGIDVLKRGGKQVDVGLPPFVRGDVSKSRQLDVSQSVAWKLEPQIDDSFKTELNADIVVDSTTHLVKSGLISGTTAARAIVAKAKIQIDAVPETTPTPTRRKSRRGRKTKSSEKKPDISESPVILDVLDLVDAKVINSVPVSFETGLLSVSKSGKFVVMRIKEGKDRLDVYDTETAEHVVAWRPYRHRPEKKFGNKSSHEVRSAIFLDETHIVTVNDSSSDADRELIVWSIPTCEAVYAVKGLSQSAVSPNGNYIACGFRSGVSLLDADSGTKIGELPIVGDPTAIAFHPRGDRVAVVHGGTIAHAWLETWNLAGGESELRIPIPETGSSLHWCGDGYLLLNNQRLIDLENEMVVWSFSLSNRLHIPTSPNARHWYLSESPQDKANIILKNVELPDPKLASILKSVKPVRETVMEPGATVSLQFSVGKPPGKTNFAQQLKDRWTSLLSKSGIKVAQNSSLRFVISSTERKTGETKKYESWGRIDKPKKTIQLAVKEATVSIKLMQNGRSVWSFERKYSNTRNFSWWLSADAPQDKVDAQMRGLVVQQLESFVPPAYVFSKEAVKGVGESTLTVNGSEVTASN